MTVRSLSRLTLALLSLALALLSNIGEQAGAAFPGYNGALTFTSDRDGNDEIYRIGPGGGTPQRLTEHPLTDDGAVWSPDGEKIAFARDIGDAFYTTWVMNADGTGAHQLTPQDAEDDEDSPTWSADGTKIAVSFWGGDNGPDIWVMDAADGGNRMNLTDSPDWDRDPSWSPDGTKIAFRSERDGNAEIYVMNADGTDQTRLTFTDGFDSGPKWTADGSRIYWTGADSYIHSIKPDGSDEQVYDGLGFADDPAPSPDGERVAFEGQGGLYTMKPDGSDVALIPGTTGDDFRPDWQPLSEPPAYAGDADCDGDADAVDSLHVLRNVAGLPNNAGCLPNANVKCDDAITSVDSLMILRYVAALPANLPQDCTPIGDPLPV